MVPFREHTSPPSSRQQSPRSRTSANPPPHASTASAEVSEPVESPQATVQDAIQQLATSIGNIHLNADRLVFPDRPQQSAYKATEFQKLVAQAQTPEAIQTLMESCDPVLLSTHPPLALAWVQCAIPLAQDNLALVEDIALLCLVMVHTDSSSTEHDNQVWGALIAHTHSLPLPAAQALMTCLQAHQEQRGLIGTAAAALETARQALQARSQHQPPARPVTAVEQNAPPRSPFLVSNPQGFDPVLPDILGVFGGGLMEMLESTVMAFEEQPVRLFDKGYADALRTLNRASILIPDRHRRRMEGSIAQAIGAMLLSGIRLSDSPELLRLRSQLPAAWWQRAWQLANDSNVKL